MQTEHLDRLLELDVIFLCTEKMAFKFKDSRGSFVVKEAEKSLKVNMSLCQNTAHMGSLFSINSGLKIKKAFTLKHTRICQCNSWEPIVHLHCRLN